jgi:hypothetical protein
VDFDSQEQLAISIQEQTDIDRQKKKEKEVRTQQIKRRDTEIKTPKRDHRTDNREQIKGPLRDTTSEGS